VGADHAKILRSLRYDGYKGRLIATDIKEKALKQTKTLLQNEETLRQMNFDIEFMLTDGLEGVPCLPMTDIIISGMGGETISDILTKSKHIGGKDIRFILQPMSKKAELIETLTGKSMDYAEYSVTDQRSGRVYTIITTGNL
jgi:tRNA A22 N-methylase